MNTRSLGNFAGGVARGYLAGKENVRQDKATALAEARGGREAQLFDSQSKFYDEMASLAKEYPTLASMVKQGTPAGGVPAAMGGVEQADQLARTAPPAAPSAPSPLASQMSAPAQPIPFVTGGLPRRLPFSY